MTKNVRKIVASLCALGVVIWFGVADASAQQYGPLAPGQIVGNPGSPDLPGGIGMTGTVTINGVVCPVNGGNCTVPFSAASITLGQIGATQVVNGNQYGVVFHNTNVPGSSSPSNNWLDDNSGWFINSAVDNQLVFNSPGYALPFSVPAVAVPWRGISLYGINTGVNVLGIGTTGNGFGGITLAAAENANPGSGGDWSFHALSNTHPLGQYVFEGYNGSAFVVGGGMQLVATQNWGAGANGGQLQWSVAPNGGTYATAMTLDWQTGLAISAPVHATEGVFTGGADFSGAAPAVGANHIGYGGTTVAAGTATCPSGTVGGQTVAGCEVRNVGGTTRYVPYY